MENIRNITFLKKIIKTPWYARIRQYFPLPELHYYNDDMERLATANPITIKWPAGVPKPLFAIIKDYEKFPRWTKYVRFLEQNGFPYEYFDLSAHDWLEKARKFDIFVGILSSHLYHLQEMRKKYFTLETYLGKACFPSTAHILLYEDKTLECYISDTCDIPYAKTYISNEKQDALRLVDHLNFPMIHKMDPGSGSLGVELVRDRKQARKIVQQAFSMTGRATHSLYFRQKNYVYFQEYIPNDGYDIRVLIIGNWVFGYYRKVLEGDFRASGMNIIEKRELPEEAIRIAWKTNQVIKSPMLVVDLVHGLDGKYTIIEFSPICQVEKPAQLAIRDIPGAYIIENEGIRFIEGKFWVHELALREFLQKDYLPSQTAMMVGANPVL
jgi:glutathione synthase/RimK-type ligase-like ATP-grasp enzyme